MNQTWFFLFVSNGKTVFLHENFPNLDFLTVQLRFNPSKLHLSDPCLKVHCGAGRICQLDQGGEPHCVCIPTCPDESDVRRKVCSNHNETWSSDCAVYQQRCLCQTDNTACKGPNYKHVHIEYYGECREMPVSVRCKVVTDFIEITAFEVELFSNVLKAWRNVGIWQTIFTRLLKVRTYTTRTNNKKYSIENIKFMNLLLLDMKQSNKILNSQTLFEIVILFLLFQISSNLWF